MRVRQLPLAAAAAALAACSAPLAPNGGEAANDSATAPKAPEAPERTVQPPAPGTPAGLPDDRTPVSEAKFDPKSAQGAAEIVQTYYALLEAGRYGAARRLWSGGGEASGSDEAAFAAGFAAYSEYHAQVGAPGAMEGAAGSSFVEVPVVIYGRRKGGETFSRKATVTLRRVNDVPGSSAEDRLWHIRTIAEAPAP
jgi:hypothetical protein